MPPPLYLVRHGQSEWNVQRLTQGQTPHPRLTELGRAQAAAAGSVLAADLGGPVRIVSSDLVRAVETASIASQHLGAEFEIDPRLREQALGSLEGLPYETTWAAAEDHDWTDPSLPIAGGESLLDVRKRMVAAIAARDASVATVFVTHGDALRSAVGALTGWEAGQEPWLDVPNGCVVKVVGDRVEVLG